MHAPKQQKNDSTNMMWSARRSPDVDTPHHVQRESRSTLMQEYKALSSMDPESAAVQRKALEKKHGPLAMRSAERISQVRNATRARVQASLRVSQPGDRYEQEADRVAEQVVDGPAPQAPVQRMEGEEDEAVATMPEISRMPESELEDDVQAKAHGGAFEIEEPTNTQVQELDSWNAEELPEAERHFFEERFGLGLADVRIHRDANAAQLANKVNARAFTSGNNIVFNEGEYQPGTREGRRLLTHEITHTIQQSKPGVQRKPSAKKSFPGQLAEYGRRLNFPYWQSLLDQALAQRGSSLAEQWPNATVIDGMYFFLETDDFQSGPEAERIARKPLHECNDEVGYILFSLLATIGSALFLVGMIVSPEPVSKFFIYGAILALAGSLGMLGLSIDNLVECLNAPERERFEERMEHFERELQKLREEQQDEKQ